MSPAVEDHFCFTHFDTFKFNIKMYAKSAVAVALFAGLSAAAPAPQGPSTTAWPQESEPTGTAQGWNALSVFESAKSYFSEHGYHGSTTSTTDSSSATAVSGYSDASAPYASATPDALTDLATKFGPDSTIAAEATAAPNATTGYTLGINNPADTLRSSYDVGPTSHGPYSGVPTVTGAANGPATLASSVGTLPPNPTATYYNSKGVPLNDLPAPYTPAGGLGTNGSLPRYMVESDFDYESIMLGLYQEWIELVRWLETSI